MNQWKMETGIGPLYILSEDDQITGIYFQSRSVPYSSEPTVLVCEAMSQISEYLEGRRQNFDLDLAPAGTAFQRAVWEELKQIPFGETISYRELAIRVGRSNACRAVGSANGKNPYGIVVPCHRVIASDGSLGGYAGGLSAKAKLLELERSVSQYGAKTATTLASKVPPAETAKISP